MTKVDINSIFSHFVHLKLFQCCKIIVVYRTSVLILLTRFGAVELMCKLTLMIRMIFRTAWSSYLHHCRNGKIWALLVRTSKKKHRISYSHILSVTSTTLHFCTSVKKTPSPTKEQAKFLKRLIPQQFCKVQVLANMKGFAGVPELPAPSPLNRNVS